MTQALLAVLLAVFHILSGFGTSAALAQDRVWLQIEAQPSLRAAEDRARAYGSVFGDVAGFQLSSGWYAIVLGPVDPLDAEGRLADLRGLQQVPGDSFVAGGSNFRAQFWPVGPGNSDRNAGRTFALSEVTPLELSVVAPGDAISTVTQPTQTIEVEPLPDATGIVDLASAAVGTPQPGPDSVPAAQVLIEPEPVIVPEETPAEARRSEAGLSRDDREYLQTALQWQGFYASDIDGDFGPGTRNAMAAWQTAAGRPATGVLTTTERAALTEAYRADLAALGLETFRDEASGIEMQLPMALVEFDHYDPPFVHFRPRSNSGVTVLLISQAGDQNTLYGLYDIMQTLEIVPPTGERNRTEQSFVLTGQSAELNSYTYAELRGGLVKGYTLAWNPRKTGQIDRVLAAMKGSFAPFGDRAMEDNVVGPTPEQRRDMLAGLEVRRPDFSRSGFYITATGLVLTTTEAVAGCGRITLDQTTEASTTLQDAVLGLAVLTPAAPLAPPAVASFQTRTPRLNSEVAAAGYSYEDAMALPTATFGTLTDLQGLGGEPTRRRLALDALPGDAGGPVLDSSGAVLGMLLPRATEGGKVLPADVNFATSAPSILAALNAAGIVLPPDTRQGGMPPEDLISLASAMTVLVSCWN